MSKPKPEVSKVGPSKLGRGLGSLIPVPIQPPTATPQQSASRQPSIGSSVPGGTVEPKPSEPNPARAVAVVAHAGEGSSQAVVFIATRAIQPGKYQPRGSVDLTALDGLARSIEQSGLMQPVVVRPLAGTPGRFELIAGERRWRAMDRLGRPEIPAIVREVDDRSAAELALIENLQREDLNPMDRAAALRRLADEFGLTHGQLAERVGLDRATISNLLRLNELDASTATHVRQGALTMGHAKVLLGITDVPARRRLAEAVISHDWSVRQLEAAAREGGVPHGTSKRRGGAPTSAHLTDLKRRLEEYLGTRVDMRLGRKKGSGELRVRFFSLDEFDGLMQRIGFKTNKLDV